MKTIKFTYEDFELNQSNVDWVLIGIVDKIKNTDIQIRAAELLECLIKVKYFIFEEYNFHTDHINPIMYEKTAELLEGFIPKIVLNKYLVMSGTEARKKLVNTFAELVVPVFKSPESTLVDKLLSLMLLWYLIGDIEVIESDNIKTHIDLAAIKYGSKNQTSTNPEDMFNVDPLNFDSILTQVFDKVVSIYYLEDRTIRDSIEYLINTIAWIINAYHKLCKV